MRSKCPDDLLLDEYVFGGMGPFMRARVFLHLARCGRCRARIKELEKLEMFLNQVGEEEPPLEFTNFLVTQARSWCANPCWSESVVEMGDRLGMRIRWLPAALLLLLSALHSWYNAGGAQSYFNLVGSDWASLAGVIDFITSGNWRIAIEGILAALKGGGIFALKVIAESLPFLTSSVILFGVVVLAKAFSQLRSLYNGGER